jgi:hypothetical protein
MPRMPPLDHIDQRHGVHGQQAPLTTWLLAMHLLNSSTTNMSALELKRHLRVCYDTARKPKRKITQAMTVLGEPGQLVGRPALNACLHLLVRVAFRN